MMISIKARAGMMIQLRTYPVFTTGTLNLVSLSGSDIRQKQGRLDVMESLVLLHWSMLKEDQTGS